MRCWSPDDFDQIDQPAADAPADAGINTYVMGQTIEPTHVNIALARGAGVSSSFGEGGGRTGRSTVQGWYQDDEISPAGIRLCPTACEAVTNDPMAGFEVLVGCSPMIEPPH